MAGRVRWSAFLIDTAVTVISRIHRLERAIEQSKREIEDNGKGKKRTVIEADVDDAYGTHLEATVLGPALLRRTQKMDSKRGQVLARGTEVTCLGRVTLDNGVERVCVRQSGEFNYSVTGWLTAKMLGPTRLVREDRPKPEKCHWGMSGDSFELTRGTTAEGVGFVRGFLGADYVEADAEQDALLLFAHGGGINVGAWYGLFLALDYRWKKAKVRFEVVAVEFSGHGASRSVPGIGISEERYDLKERAPRDLFSVLDDPSFPVVGRPVYGFGHGAGATILLLSELRRPGAFHGFGLFEPLLFGEENPDAVAAFGKSRWAEDFAAFYEKLDVQRQLDDGADSADVDIATDDFMVELATNVNDNKIYRGLPFQRWDASTAFRIRTYGVEEKYKENSIKYETLTLTPDVEECFFRGIPPAAKEARDRLGELRAPCAFAVASEAAVLADTADASQLAYLALDDAQGAKVRGPLLGIGPTRGKLALCPGAAAAGDVPLVDPEWSARFVDAVLGNLRCWTYLPQRKTFNYTDFTEAHDDTVEAPDPHRPPCRACGCTAADGGSATLSFVPKLLRCSRCAGVVYCCAQCQRNDWPRHKKECDPAAKKANLAAAAAAAPKKPEKKRAEEAPAGPKLFQCENGCGYHDEWDEVCAHEENCTFGLDVQ